MDKHQGEVGEGESSMDAHTLTHVNIWPMATCWVTQGIQTGLCNNLEGWEWVRGRRETQEGGDICTHMVNSC